MPTTEQLFDSWESQYILGLSDEQYYCNDYSNEMTGNRDSLDDMEFSGESIGTIEYDPKKGEISILPYSEMQIIKYDPKFGTLDYLLGK